MKYTTELLKDVIEWDVPNWSEALRFWDKRLLNKRKELKALEIGAQNGGLSLWAALKGMQVVCSNLGEPTPEAVAKHERYQVTDKISYEALDALDIPHKREFDVVLFKSVLGGVGAHDNYDNQVKAVRQMYEALKEEGEMWFVENLTGSGLHKFLRNKFIDWGNSWRYLELNEVKALLADFSEVEMQTLGFLGAFGRNNFQRNLLGKLDRLFFDKIVPRGWHYIVVVVAKK